MTILSINLGKFKSVSSVYAASSASTELQSVEAI